MMYLCGLWQYIYLILMRLAILQLINKPTVSNLNCNEDALMSKCIGTTGSEHIVRFVVQTLLTCLTNC